MSKIEDIKNIITNSAETTGASDVDNEKAGFNPWRGKYFPYGGFTLPGDELKIGVDGMALFGGYGNDCISEVGDMYGRDSGNWREAAITKDFLTNELSQNKGSEGSRVVECEGGAMHFSLSYTSSSSNTNKLTARRILVDSESKEITIEDETDFSSEVGNLEKLYGVFYHNGKWYLLVLRTLGADKMRILIIDDSDMSLIEDMVYGGNSLDYNPEIYVNHAGILAGLWYYDFGLEQWYKIPYYYSSGGTVSTFYAAMSPQIIYYHKEKGIIKMFFDATSETFLEVDEPCPCKMFTSRQRGNIFVRGDYNVGDDRYYTFVFLDNTGRIATYSVPSNSISHIQNTGIQPNAYGISGDVKKLSLFDGKKSLITFYRTNTYNDWTVMFEADTYGEHNGFSRIYGIAHVHLGENGGILDVWRLDNSGRIRVSVHPFSETLQEPAMPVSVVYRDGEILIAEESALRCFDSRALSFKRTIKSNDERVTSSIGANSPAICTEGDYDYYYGGLNVGSKKLIRIKKSDGEEYVYPRSAQKVASYKNYSIQWNGDAVRVFDEDQEKEVYIAGNIAISNAKDFVLRGQYLYVIRTTGIYKYDLETLLLVDSNETITGASSGFWGMVFHNGHFFVGKEDGDVVFKISESDLSLVATGSVGGFPIIGHKNTVIMSKYKITTGELRGLVAIDENTLEMVQKKHLSDRHSNSPKFGPWETSFVVAPANEEDIVVGVGPIDDAGPLGRGLQLYDRDTLARVEYDYNCDGKLIRRVMSTEEMTVLEDGHSGLPGQTLAFHIDREGGYYGWPALYISRGNYVVAYDIRTKKRKFVVDYRGLAGGNIVALDTNNGALFAADETGYVFKSVNKDIVWTSPLFDPTGGEVQGEDTAIFDISVFQGELNDYYETVIVSGANTDVDMFGIIVADDGAEFVYNKIGEFSVVQSVLKNPFYYQAGMDGPGMQHLKLKSTVAWGGVNNVNILNPDDGNKHAVLAAPGKVDIGFRFFQGNKGHTVSGVEGEIELSGSVLFFKNTSTNKRISVFFENGMGYYLGTSQYLHLWDEETNPDILALKGKRQILGYCGEEMPPLPNEADSGNITFPYLFDAQYVDKYNPFSPARPVDFENHHLLFPRGRIRTGGDRHKTRLYSIAPESIAPLEHTSMPAYIGPSGHRMTPTMFFEVYEPGYLGGRDEYVPPTPEEPDDGTWPTDPSDPNHPNNDPNYPITPDPNNPGDYIDPNYPGDPTDPNNPIYWNRRVNIFFKPKMW